MFYTQWQLIRSPRSSNVLKPELSSDQIETARLVLDPLLTRIRTQTEKLPPQADSALVYLPVDEPEAGQ